MTAGNNIEGRLAYSRSDATRSSAYTMTARVLHWTTAFLVLSTIPLGIVAANDWGGSMQDAIYDLHRSIGATLIPLVFLRLIYRWTHPPLPLPDDIPPTSAICRAYYALGSLHSSDCAAAYRLDCHFRLSGLGDCLWLV